MPTALRSPLTSMPHLSVTEHCYGKIVAHPVSNSMVVVCTKTLIHIESLLGSLLKGAQAMTCTRIVDLMNNDRIMSFVL